MRELTPEGRRTLEDVAARHGVSPGTARSLAEALVAGGGMQAQFDVPELGGMGQWSRGGMVMIGDMFNNALKARVDSLCIELSGLLAGAFETSAAASQAQSQGAGSSLFVAGAGGGDWWPAGLGRPGATGAQNDMRYAWFPLTRRLAIAVGDRVTVYDTGDHRIGGFGQQQAGDRSLTFTSQSGTVRVADLPVVVADPSPAAPAPAAAPPTTRRAASDDPIAQIERLAGLRDRGVLTEKEFGEKKAELLARL